MIGSFKTNWLIIILLSFVIFGCNKENVIIDYQLVVTKTDLSINTDSDILIFDIVNSSTYFAAAKSTTGQLEIFKTFDSGES